MDHNDFVGSLPAIASLNASYSQASLSIPYPYYLPTPPAERRAISDVRRTFCLFVTFDLLFISLLWIIELNVSACVGWRFRGCSDSRRVLLYLYSFVAWFCLCCKKSFLSIRYTVKHFELPLWMKYAIETNWSCRPSNESVNLDSKVGLPFPIEGGLAYYCVIGPIHSHLTCLLLPRPVVCISYLCSLISHHLISPFSLLFRCLSLAVHPGSVSKKLKNKTNSKSRLTCKWRAFLLIEHSKRFIDECLRHLPVHTSWTTIAPHVTVYQCALLEWILCLLRRFSLYVFYGLPLFCFLLTYVNVWFDMAGNVP